MAATFKCRHILLFQADVQALRTAEDATILLASLTDRRSVHNRKQFFNIINKELVKQPLIPLLLSKKAKQCLCERNKLSFESDSHPLVTTTRISIYLKIHHGHVLVQRNIILSNIVHHLLFL